MLPNTLGHKKGDTALRLLFETFVRNSLVDEDN
jgi:hypothetical protein